MTYTTEYGTNVTGKPFLSSEGTWFRVDEWTNSRTEEVFHERRFCAGRHDESEQFSESRHGYNSKCVECWLNFSHTLEQHNKQVQK